MSEGEFWNNLDSFVEKKNPVSKQAGKEEIERVGTWLQDVAESVPQTPKQSASKISKRKPSKVIAKPISAYKGGKFKKSKKGEDENSKKGRKCLLEAKDDKKLYIPRRIFARRMKAKKTKKNDLPLNFGSLVDCTFNLPRVAQKLERLMGSSIVRLTDRKYMLELQKRIKEDYHETLLKRISKRESEEVERQLGIMLNPQPDIGDFSRILFTAQSIVLSTELERTRRAGNAGNEKYPKMISEHPVFLVNNKTNALLMSKREKLKTVREKNATELIKQGKRWERERLRMTEEERVNEIEMRKEREKMLEEHTLYIFDPDKADIKALDLARARSRKYTDCEIDLKNFLLSERENLRKKMIDQQEQETHLLTVAQESKFNVQLTSDLSSFEDRQDEGDTKSDPKSLKPELPISEKNLQITAEEMKRKQANKDEDPQIARFKSAETVKEMYTLAEGIIAGDGKKSKLLKQIKQLRKSLNVSVIKGAQ